MAESVFLEDPDCPTLVVNSNGNKTTTKVLSNEPGGRARLFFSFFLLFYLFHLFIILFISFILLIQFNYYFIYFIYFINSIQFRTYFINSIQVLTFLKDARTRRLPESTSRSGRARSHGLTGPLSVRLCDPYVLARPRTTSTNAPRNPSMLVPSQQKNQTNPEKRKKILVDLASLVQSPPGYGVAEFCATTKK